MFFSFFFIVIGILLLGEFYKQKETLLTGVPVSVLITKINCNNIRRRAAKIEFIYKANSYSTTINRKECNNLLLGSRLILLHIEGTDDFVELNEKPKKELIGSITAFFIGTILIFISVIVYKKK